MISTIDKALQVNLDPAVYGTFAEIGAGQETANWFFKASGTAGGVAKTISAYDMTMSDAIYGHSKRYVSAERLGSMLDHEYAILIERLTPIRGANTTFFSFANTVRARGWKDNGECHGWLGIRFQVKPGDPPSEITLHVRLLDVENNDQADALGVVGVNLIYAAFYHRHSLKNFVDSLVDNIDKKRIEIDLLKFSGNNYQFFDNRLCALQLVESSLTEATMFLPNGDVVQPAEALYNKPVLLLRGSFNPVLNVHLAMLERSREIFFSTVENTDDQSSAIELCEMSMHNLLHGGAIDHLDFLDRADALQALGKTVLLSRCAEFHRIAGFLSRCTKKPIGLVLSIGLLHELFKDKWSQNLDGGLLESFGRLFKNGITLLVCPWKNRKTGEIVTADNFIPPATSTHLYQHFLTNKKIVSIPLDSEKHMSLLKNVGRDIDRLICAQDATWKEYVPQVAWKMAEKKAKESSDLANLKDPVIL